MSKFQYTSDGRIKAWVDGSYVPSQSRGAIGVWFDDAHLLNVSESSPGVGKNHNDFELKAAERALEIIQRQGMPGHVFTDSAYVNNHCYKWHSLYNVFVQQVSRDDHGIQKSHKLASAALQK